MNTILTRWVCDRCQDTVEVPGSHRAPEGWVVLRLQGDLGRSLAGTRDLCPQCAAEVVEYLDSGPKRVRSFRTERKAPGDVALAV